MSIFHETMREILEDVQKFLNLTLQREHLTAASISHKESLLMKIHRLRTEYPQLHLQLIAESPTCTSGNGQDDALQQSSGSSSIHHVSPPPYIDMQGNNVDTDYVYSDTANVDEYEVCDVESQYRDSKVMSEEGDSSNDYKEHEIPYIPASDLTNVVKCGYLEKKGKDRLGGWLNLFQKRFVALKDGILYLYNKNSDKKPYCMLPLRGYDVRTASTAVKDGSKKDVCFELVGPGKKTYQFVAASNGDARQWVEAVQAMIANIPRETSLPAALPVDVVESPAVKSGHTDENSTISRDDIYEVVEDKVNRDSTVIEEELYEDAANNSESGIATTDGGTFVTDLENPLDWYVGLWDCSSCSADELGFSRGDLIRVVDREFNDCKWWIGDLNGQVGLVPKEYLMRAYESVEVT